MKKLFKGLGKSGIAFIRRPFLSLKNNSSAIFLYCLGIRDLTSVGFDMSCGSGRWAIKVAPRVGLLNCVDARQEALDVAKHNLRSTLM